MPSFFEANADLFSLDPSARKSSMADDMTQRRQYLAQVAPEVAAQLPPLPGQAAPQPGAASAGPGTAPQTDLSQVLRQIAQPLAQQLASQQVQPSPDGKPPSPRTQANAQAGAMEQIQALLADLNPLQQKKTYGPDIGKALGMPPNSGGILGLGFTPIQAILFAVTAGLTSRLPQDQALKTTMAIASLPEELRSKQEKAIRDTINDKLNMLRVGHEEQRIGIEQAKLGEVQRGLQARGALASVLAQAGRPADALAVQANMVDDWLKITQQPGGDKLPPPEAVVQALSNLRANPNAPIPPIIAQMVGGNTPEEVRQGADRMYRQILGTRQPVALPGGGAVVMTPEGPAILENAPVLPQSPLITAPAPSRPAQPAPAAPTAQAPQGTGAIIDRLAQSPSKQDQWVAKYLTDLPPSAEVEMRPLFARPIDAGDRQRLIAQRATLEFARELQGKYEAMVQSYAQPGDTPEQAEKRLNFKEQLRQYGMAIGTKVEGAEGLGGLITTLGTDLGRAAAQRMGKPFSPETMDFLATYSQAQKFARGAMQDAANLATKERNMFGNMIGHVMDTPAVFRSSIGAFIRSTEKDHKILMNALEGKTGAERLRESTILRPGDGRIIEDR